MRTAAALLICFALTLPAFAGTGYRAKATGEDGKSVTYEVNFGGGKLFEQYTAFNPDTGKFVYLRFNRREQAPEPAALIWDHQTGKEIKLYTFEGAEHPLAVIPSIRGMKFCPITGDDDFKAEPFIACD